MCGWLNCVSGSFLVIAVVIIGKVLSCDVSFPVIDWTSLDQTAPFLLQECRCGIYQLRISKHGYNTVFLGRS